MSDALKHAARARMAITGEKYRTARRAVLKIHKEESEPEGYARGMVDAAKLVKANRPHVCVVPVGEEDCRVDGRVCARCQKYEVDLDS